MQKILYFLLLVILVLGPAYAGNPPPEVGGSSTITSSQTYNDDIQTIWGTGSDFACEYDTEQTPDAFVCGTSEDSNNFIIAAKAELPQDFSHEQSAEPNLIIQGSNSSISITASDQGGNIVGQDGYVGVLGTDIALGSSQSNYVLNVIGSTPVTQANPSVAINPPGASAIAGGTGDYQILNVSGTIGSGTQSQEFTGINSYVINGGSGVISGTGANSMRAGLFQAYQDSSNTVSQMEAINAEAVSMPGAGTKGLVTTQRGVLVTTGYGASASGSGSITTSTGVSVQTPQSTAAGRTITNYYGLKIENAQATGITNAYAIWTGTGQNLFGDQVTISNAASASGTTALTINMGAHTAVSTNTPALTVNAYTNTLNSGASLSNASGVELQAPTYNGVAGGGTESVTDAATIRVVGPAVAGSDITITNAYAMLIDSGDSRFDGFIISNPQTVTIADDGAGTPALSTVTPSSNNIQITCNDTNGCNVTMSESGQKNGTTIRLVNMSANAVSFSDSSGVSETAGSFNAGQYDSITMTYQSDRWIEDSRANN